jgi:N-acetylmuramoyl-L-alanine amidase
MRLYRLEDSGEPVRDIQDRLFALGHPSDPDPRGEYGKATADAVRSFQADRGLNVDGIVGPDTWRALYEAGYRLGDRLLVLRRPMLRGDDVGELQNRLNNLGFDAGKPDGIFGVDTQRALIEFQHNRGLPEDGVAGPEVLTELRLVSRGQLETGRETVREREWLRSLRPTVVGTRVFFDPASRSVEEAASAWEAATAASIALQERGGLPVISRSMDAHMPERVRAHRANRQGADVIVSFQLAEDDEEGVFSFETAKSRSEAGARLAGHVSRVLGTPTGGRATAILRETRSPAIVVSLRTLDSEIGRLVVEGIERFFDEHGRYPGRVPDEPTST